MRQLLFVLLAALPAVAVQAEPFATYDPATGDVVLRNVRDSRSLAFGITHWPYFLNDGEYYEAPIVAPSGSELPEADAFRNAEGQLLFLEWRMARARPTKYIQFDSLTVNGIVPHGTPIEALHFRYDLGGTLNYEGDIKLVPEPTTLVLSLALVRLAALRCRK